MIKDNYNFNFISIDKPTLYTRKSIYMRFVCLVITFAFLFLTTVNIQTVSTQTFKVPLHIDLSKTLGFIMVQRVTLNWIKG